ncbi:MAG: ATP-dependent zinc metalloprotease FtsH [Rhodocyclaceae bacterium]|nr:MAG: AAA family ATPase [Rhodocyclaceae bacterium]MBE7423096.1 AAA family ATPase [Zoogloeaceae bacterium]MBV6406766.1 ATP-dependent zinc metalloprotease FtsH [Rhodocyclaceae bacterium]MCK6384570.1 AAA family ATPase [Rhodocyclaceae bacterium]CAG0931087.1 ATP-dependent zinc metalloprotease FtsH 3 [Rhodocyclaceae bacterium]
MNDLHDLTLILQSRFPLVVIETHEEPRVLALLDQAANLEGWALFVWSIADGLRRSNNTQPISQTYEFLDALRHIDKTPQNGVYVMLDAHPYLADPVNARLIREIAMEYGKSARTLVFISPRLDLDPELSRMSARFQLSVPDLAAIQKLLREEMQLWQQQGGGEPVRGEKEALQLLARHLTGMALDDARRLARQAIRDDGLITHGDVERVLRYKYDALGAGSMLSLELDTASFAQVGGVKKLKHWLDLRRAVFVGEGGAGLQAPKGIMLLGVQGSGKSLAAKAVAGAWGVPLLRLDFATLYNKFFGETERNLREALAAAEAMAPCVLWIDEIEKGLASDSSGGTDGGVSRRILGTLLTWLSERKGRVFIVATANDIAQLPPELIRKGRLDEIFFVDLPDAPTRAEIFAIHLTRRELKAAGFDLDVLAGAADGFSGAEIEQAVVSALYEAHAQKLPLDQALLLAEVGRTRPLSVVMAERVAALRDWAADRTVPAN